MAQVRACIQENYQDPLLNVSLIANKLGRNLSTLSHQYKDLTGRGLLEDLHSVRLEAAKRLLKEGKTVRETAELSGYGDSRALIRAFKRYEEAPQDSLLTKNKHCIKFEGCPAEPAKTLAFSGFSKLPNFAELAGQILAIYSLLKIH